MWWADDESSQDKGVSEATMAIHQLKGHGSGSEPNMLRRSDREDHPGPGQWPSLCAAQWRLLLALEEVIERGIMSGKYVQGQYVAALEQLIEERWQVPDAVAVNSGSSALRLALEALELEAGSEVLVPALTFISTAFAVSDAGLVPVFVDVDPQTLTLDPEAAQAAITEKTVAMVPVHLYGQMADMFPLLDLADTSGLYVVEDAAQAHGATYTSSCSSAASESV
jgi:dTDP-4-amino-4,6-dideoxygalactose transaminase